jgi:hypothetical protein
MIAMFPMDYATLLKEYHLSLLLIPRIQLTSQSPRLPIATPPGMRPAVPGTTLRREAALIAMILKEYRLSLLLSPRIQLMSQSPRLPIAKPCMRPAVPGATLRRVASFLKYRWTTMTTTFLRKDIVGTKRFQHLYKSTKTTSSGRVLASHKATIKHSLPRNDHARRRDQKNIKIHDVVEAGFLVGAIMNEG